MSMNLQDITLQSADGRLQASNDNGRLIAPILCLNRQPVAEDAQGFDNVLVFVDSDSTLHVHPLIINLNEENNYFQSLYIQTEGKWSISGVVNEFIRLESSSGQLEGIGNARIDVTKAPTLVSPGGYSCQFQITLANADGTTVTVQVFLTVNVPLTVDGRGNGQTLTINLNAANNYTETLTIIRDREWSVENVNTNMINVSPMSGNGQGLPDFASTLTVTKSPILTPSTTATTVSTTFQVVSLFQRVNVVVNITMPALTITGEFIDPLPGTNPIYIYI